MIPFIDFPVQPKTIILMLEGLSAAFLFMKIFISTIIIRGFKKKNIKEGYWFYFHFALFYLIYIIIHLIKNLYFEGPIDITCRPKFNPILVDYFKNIFFMSSFPCLMIFCYKTAMDNPTTNFYTGDVAKKQRDNKISKWAIYIGSSVISFVQALMIGMIPLSMYLIYVGTGPLLGALVSLTSMILLCKHSTGCRNLLYTWTVFIAFSAIVIPFSYLLSIMVNLDPTRFGDLQDLYKMLLMGPFLLMRIAQLVTLSINAFSFKDLRWLYDC